jgi:hypothetical protein
MSTSILDDSALRLGYPRLVLLLLPLLKGAGLCSPATNPGVTWCLASKALSWKGAGRREARYHFGYHRFGAATRSLRRHRCGKKYDSVSYGKEVLTSLRLIRSSIWGHRRYTNASIRQKATRRNDERSSSCSMNGIFHIFHHERENLPTRDEK